MEQEKMVVDLSVKSLNEIAWYTLFGVQIASILKAMIGNYSIPLSVKGNKNDVVSFANVLSKEKQYLESFRKLGLDNPSTFRDKMKLNKAIAEFERSTNIPWPLR